eukprot:Amastigsp_a676282_157.p4 type:complete len:101 gc:universal Amastigsp_a676282_157:609-307(-)
MMVEQRRMRAIVVWRAMSRTMGQYSSERPLISSAHQTKRTWRMSMPHAFHTSIMYWPTMRILRRSPPILLLSSANQSATQKIKSQPALVSLFTLMALRMP